MRYVSARALRLHVLTDRRCPLKAAAYYCAVARGRASLPRTMRSARGSAFDRCSGIRRLRRRPRPTVRRSRGSAGCSIRRAACARDSARISGWELAALLSPEQMVGNWIARGPITVQGPFPYVSRTGNWDDVAHYTQVVWSGTTHVGCAIYSAARLGLSDLSLFAAWQLGRPPGRLRSVAPQKLKTVAFARNAAAKPPLMTVLVTGVAGFIGSTASRVLCSRAATTSSASTIINDYYDPALKQARLDRAGARFRRSLPLRSARFLRTPVRSTSLAAHRTSTGSFIWAPRPVFGTASRTRALTSSRISSATATCWSSPAIAARAISSMRRRPRSTAATSRCRSGSRIASIIRSRSTLPRRRPTS